MEFLPRYNNKLTVSKGFLAQTLTRTPAAVETADSQRRPGLCKKLFWFHEKIDKRGKKTLHNPDKICREL